MDVDIYLKIADFFRFRYDPAVLSLIAERPHRFRELVSRLESEVHSHVDDNAVDRSLKRLARVRHIRKANMRVGQRNVPIYIITEAGNLHLGMYDAFVDAFHRIQHDSEKAGPLLDGDAR